MTDSLDAQLVKAARDGDAPAVRRLLDIGATVDGGETKDLPLFQAAHYGHTECVLLLLERGAALDGTTAKGYTALMGAANQGHLELIDLFIALGAQPGLRSLDNEYTAADWAVEGKRLDAVERLIAPMPPKRLPEFPDIVVCNSLIGDRVLQEVFSFTHHEVVSLIRKGEKGPVEAVMRQDFSAIENQQRLMDVFNIYKSRGGKLSQQDAIPDVTAKPAVPRLHGRKG